MTNDQIISQMTPSRLQAIKNEVKKSMMKLDQEMNKAKHLRDYRSISQNSDYIDRMTRILQDGYFAS